MSGPALSTGAATPAGYRIENTIQVEGQAFWLDRQDGGGNPYQEPADWQQYDRAAGGFRWSIMVKGPRQHRFRPRGLMADAVRDMLDAVRAELKTAPGATVRLLTPDVALDFYL
ncbi:hypothetical protein ACU4GI_32650 [Cupriavidus basilensis]